MAWSLCFCESYVQKLHLVLRVNTGEKFLCASSRGGEKENLLKYARALCSSVKELPSEEIILPEPNLLE